MAAILPTFNLGPHQIVKDKSDIILYTIRHVMLTPGATSSIMEDDILSFRKLEAEYGGGGNELAIKLESGLTKIFERYFPDNIPIVTVDKYDIAFGLYGLSVEVVDAKGNNLILRTKVDVINDNEIIINYESGG
jgi:hypothetical protein